MIKGILIDLDGTLVDTIPALYQVYIKFLERYGHQGTPEEFESLIGPSIEDIVKILKKKYTLKESEKDLTTIYTSFIILQRFEGTTIFPGAKAFLTYTKKHKLKLGLVTSGTSDLVKSCLEPHGVYDMFDVVITAEDVKTGKPDPSIYKKALHALKLKKEQVIAIEDSIAGVQAASGAGIFTLLFNPQMEPYGISSAVYKQIADWAEILEWLKTTVASGE